MRASLKLISLLLLLFQLPCLAQEEIVLTDSVVVDTLVVDTVAADTAEIRQYNLLLQVRRDEISGICVMKMISETEVIGTVINEFGLTAFDFEYKEGETQLSNLPPILDKWYIRRILQEDLSFFFSNLPLRQDKRKRGREITFSPDGEITLENNRFRIKYTFTPIIEE
jgi:hypothetical protein